MGLGAKANGDPVGNWQAQGAQGAGDIIRQGALPLSRGSARPCAPPLPGVPVVGEQSSGRIIARICVPWQPPEGWGSGMDPQF